MRSGRSLVVLLLVGVGPSVAGGSRTIEVDDFRKLEGLKLEGAGLSADGGVVPAPEPTILLGGALPIVWDLRAGRSGEVAIAGGAPGLAALLGRDRAVRRLHESPEADVTCVAELEPGSVAFGLTPGGQVLIHRPDGAVRPLLETGARFLWDMVADASGTLWVAAGDPGGVFRIDRDERSRRVLDLGLEQARCLAPAPGGGVYVGTSGGGVLRRIAPSGAAEVLFESGHAEIAALAPLPDGGLVLALAAAGATESPGSAGAAAAGPASAPRPAVSVTVVPVPPAAPPPGARTRSEVVRWHPERGVERLWSSERETALAVLADGDGGIWLGTSPHGAVYRMAEPGRWEQVIVLPARAVTRLRRDADGRLLVATAGPGLAVRLDASRRADGIAEGAVVDLGAGARLGDLEWWTRGEGRVELAWRSGPRALPDVSWSAWSPWRAGGALEAPSGATGRFVQWRARLRAEAAGARAPELTRLRLTWLPANRPPRVDRVDVLAPGLGIEMGPSPAGQLQPPPDSPAAAALASENPGLAPNPRAGTRRVWAPGRRTVAWEAQDEDGDALEARLLLRADSDSDFTPFSAWGPGHFLSFDESALPDGGYVARVEVRDAPGNDAARARQTAADSARFVIDRTPPLLAALRWSAGGARGGALEFAAEDAQGPLAGARVQIDDGDPRTAPAVDGVEDGRAESYRLTLEDLSPGAHVALVRVRDALGNEAAARLVFRLP